MTECTQAGTLAPLEKKIQALGFSFEVSGSVPSSIFSLIPFFLYVLLYVKWMIGYFSLTLFFSLQVPVFAGIVPFAEKLPHSPRFTCTISQV